MTNPQSTAMSLIEKYREHAYPPESLDEEDYAASELRIAKACAIIAVETIQERLGYIFTNDADHDAEFKHWEEIKIAINKL